MLPNARITLRAESNGVQRVQQTGSPHISNKRALKSKHLYCHGKDLMDYFIQCKHLYCHHKMCVVQMGQFFVKIKMLLFIFLRLHAMRFILYLRMQPYKK